MKHRVAGRKLGRTSAHRLAVLRNLSISLFRHERVRTTLMKAKELRPFAERLITAGKRGDVHARRRVARSIHDTEVAKKLVDTISTRFAERPGGYTRIVKLGPRRGDGAEMAVIELIGSELKIAPQAEVKKEQKGLGRIRERFSRRRSAPEGEEDKDAGSGAEEKPSRRGRASSGGGRTEPKASPGGARAARGGTPRRAGRSSKSGSSGK